MKSTIVALCAVFGAAAALAQSPVWGGNLVQMTRQTMAPGVYAFCSKDLARH